MNPDELRKMFKRSVRNKWTLSELEVALDIAADAWEADRDRLFQYDVLREHHKEHHDEFDALRKRLEAMENDFGERMAQKQSEVDHMCVYAGGLEKRLEAAEKQNAILRVGASKRLEAWVLANELVAALAGKEK